VISQPGEYFVTICTHNQECILGKIINGEMRLNEVGKIVGKCWEEILRHFTKLELDEFEILLHALRITVTGLRLPDHLHEILTINEPWVKYVQPNTKNTNVGVQNFEPLPQNTYQHIIPKSLGSIIRSYKAAVTRECRKYGHYDFGWQRNFYDRIIRNDKELNNIRDYIYPVRMIYSIVSIN
jgi:REP element-mobilizing transposase RayT